ncbi:MAG: 30S ribosomal protein S15 [Bacteroidota bacterium]|nr:30S ribosomal protein S15 [Bacteroidota bacterium]
MNIEEKKSIFEKYGNNSSNTGSPESQIALFSQRIKHLTKHLKIHKKDFSTQRGLYGLVGKRRKLLNYLMEKDIEKYRELIKDLGIRK